MKQRDSEHAQEVEPHDDDGDAGGSGEEVEMPAQCLAEHRGRRPEENEDRGEPHDEKQRGEDSPPPDGASTSSPVIWSSDVPAR